MGQDIKILLTIKQFDKGKDFNQFLDWLKVGLRVFTDDKYEIEVQVLDE